MTDNTYLMLGGCLPSLKFLIQLQYEKVLPNANHPVLCMYLPTELYIRTTLFIQFVCVKRTQEADH